MKDLTIPLKVHGSAVATSMAMDTLTFTSGRFREFKLGQPTAKSFIHGRWSRQPEANEFLPGLAKSKGEQVQFAEFDVDRDGHLDLIIGGQCGRNHTFLE